MKTYNALDLLLNNKRLDLISKYLYIKFNDKYKEHTKFFEEYYCAFIQAFNGFYENSDGEIKPKEGKFEFLKKFNEVKTNIEKNGYDNTKPIPTWKEEVSDGAHRVSICAAFNLNIPTVEIENKYIYDYKFFQKKDLLEKWADYTALEFVKLNPQSYIVNIHAVNNPKNDEKIEKILNKYGHIYYKKDVYLTYNGYVNLKKLSYGFDNWGENSWIGNERDNYAGAQSHAKKSYGKGKHPLRAYVFVCKSLDDVIKAKKEIRDFYNIGNYSVHINDSRKEALELAETYFNENSLEIINSRPFSMDTPKVDNYIKELTEYAQKNNINLDEICACGSTPLAIAGIREIKDFDFLYCGSENINIPNNEISQHSGVWESYYPANKYEIILNPEYHFYYKGIKFISLNTLKQMKTNRNEQPKDVNDCKMIDEFMAGTFKFKKNKFKINRIITKQKYGSTRKITILGFIKFSYTKKSKK